MGNFITGKLDFLNTANTVFGGFSFTENELLARLKWFREVSDNTDSPGVIYVPANLREGTPLLITKHSSDEFSV